MPLAAADNVKGRIDIPMSVGGGMGGELLVMEPSMCEGEGHTVIKYDKARNRVELRARFKGLPYRPNISYGMDLTKDYPFNRYPESVSDGKWQIWFVGRMFNKPTVFYYDRDTLDLLGNEFDLDEVPVGAIPLQAQAVQMVCTDFFESDPETLEANVRFVFRYDRILDHIGSAGALFATVPRNLCRPNDLIGYYTQGGLPASEAMSFDDVLAMMRRGGALAIATSYEPFPKPRYLAARDNIMIGFAGSTLPMSAPPPRAAPTRSCRGSRTT